MERLLLLLCVLCVILLCDGLDRISVDSNDHVYIDESNRQIIFRGLNHVQKGFPWYDYYII